MSEKSLKEKTFSGLGWSSVDKIFQQIVVLVSGITLARMLSLEDYGLIGLVAIFSGLSNVLIDSGFTAALIRKKNVTQSDYLTVFYSNITVATFLYLVLFFCAPLISNYYDEPILTPLSRIVFLSFLFSAFGVVQNAKLLKEINYKLITKSNIVAILISYSVALALAWLGYGFWALAAQIVIQPLVKTCYFWIFTRWKPTGSFSKESLKEFLSFSASIAVGGILGTINTNIPQNVLGKVYSNGIVGLYNQANRLFNTVSDFLFGSILSVPYSTLSTIDDEERLKRVFRKFVRIKSFVVFPMFMGIILVADSFVNVLLGSKWNDAVPILQLLCIGGIFNALDTSSGDMLKIKGKSQIILLFIFLQTVFIVGAIALTILLKLDYIWLIAMISSVYIFKYVIQCIITCRMIDYKFTESFMDLFPYFTVTLISIGIGYGMSYFISHKLILMLVQIPLVATVYIGSLYFLGSAIIKELIDVLKKKTVEN